MKPRTSIVAAGFAVAVLALSAPAQGQSARIAIGAVFTAGPQYPQRPSPYPDRPWSGRHDVYGGYGSHGYVTNRGFNDGYEQGFEAARHRDRFDPRRERWYRDGERGYDRDLRLSRNEYRDLYRRGFLEGYESGYREAQRAWRGGYGRDGRYDGRSQGGWRNW